MAAPRPAGQARAVHSPGPIDIPGGGGVRALFETFAREFLGSTFWFDSISRWLADLTLRPRGLRLTEDYTTPRMPFGANINKAPALFRSWVPGLEVKEEPWPL